MNIVFGNHEADKVKFEISDLSGKVLLEEIAQPDCDLYRVNLKALVPGIYFLGITSLEQKQMLKFIVNP